jgi:hypothetical protein
MVFQIERGLVIPFPVELGIVLLLITGTASALTVVNLALSGLGAPFAIAVSKRVANRWMYNGQEIRWSCALLQRFYQQVFTSNLSILFFGLFYLRRLHGYIF